MNQPIRVLAVEDSEEDTLLLIRELQRGGYDPTLERVETPEAMSAALNRQPWDLVIADYTMPYFKGTDALELLRKTGMDLPFIFLSGTLGEDTAVAAMKVGANDYIMKGSLKRLIPAIERELRETEERRQRKRAEELVKRQQEQIRALHEINLDITSTLDLGGVLELLLAKIDLVLPFPVATTVRLLNPETGKLDPIACRNVDEVEWKGNGWKGTRGASQLVFATKAPMLIRNIQINPRIENREFYLKHGLVSYLGIPLVAKGEVLGVLGFYAKKEHDFTREEIDFLSALADQAAMAIQNSRLYERTKKQAAELERANKVKSEFLSVMSHELRTPLSAVVGYTGMVVDGSLGAINLGQEKTLRKVIRQSNELLAMINSILEVGKMEGGETKVQIQEVNLNALLDDLRSVYDFPQAEEIVLLWNYPRHLPAMRTDSGKLRHILQNLINNAIKYTEKGRITTSACFFVRAQAVEFKVSDTGIGIPKESLEGIFEMFRQVNSSGTRAYSGVGLGLYIVKKFTELLGGRVEVESKPGVGSTFTVTLPLRLDDKLAAKSPQ